jgi:cytochrome bd-type quinol oxidase subunit 2
METQFAIEAAERRARWVRLVAVKSLGPLTVAGGVIWAFAQPYRVTLLHPRGESFWWLAIEPPLLVILVGLAFALCVVPGLVEDLEEDGDAARG